MSFKQIFGWILLTAGVCIIIGTLYSSYNIFSAKTPVPEIFSIPSKDSFNKKTGLPKSKSLLSNPEEKCRR